MTVCYGIKCISSKSSEPITLAGRGGWTLGSRGLETWCKTRIFPFYDINEVHQELHFWGTSTQYTYRVEEIPHSLLPSLIDAPVQQISIPKLKEIEDENTISAVDGAKNSILEAEDKRVFEAIEKANFIKYGNTSDTDLKEVLKQSVKYAPNADLKEALKQIVEYASKLENRKVKTHNDGYDLDYFLGEEF